MKSVYIFSLFILTCCSYSLMAQKLHFESPVAFSDTLNSQAEEGYPLYSDRDSVLFFVRTLHEENTGGLLSGQDIWYSKRLPSGQWSLPSNNLENLNNVDNNAVVGVAESGSTLYVMNTYGQKEVSKAGLSAAPESSTQWASPRAIDIPTLENKQGNFYGLYVAPTEDVAIISMQNEKSIGMEDLFVSLKDPATKQWSAPVHLGPTINTSGFEISPYLSKDKRTIFFSSNGHPGYGNADIFSATRMDSSWTNWTKPENLGDEINSVGFDAYLTINDNNEVFFVSNRQGGSADIFYAKAITEEERATNLAERIQSRGDFEQVLGSSSTDPETQALITETQRLLDEFRKERGKSNTNTNTAENAVEENPNERTLYFALNSAEVRDEITPELELLAEELKQNPTLNVKVVGHADDTGGGDYNLRLSIARAQAIKKYLNDVGIDESRIITFGKGSTQPVTSNESLEGRSKNRRVEVEFFTF